MCKDTFGKQAINSTSMTPRLLKTGQELTSPRPRAFIPLREGGPDGAVGETTGSTGSTGSTGPTAFGGLCP